MKERTSKNKGFTLIELLAVIVILAVIALIAIPLIMRVINNARKNSSKDNAYGFVKAVEFSLATNMTDEEGNFDGNYTIEGKSIKSEKKTLPVKYKGTPVSGELIIHNNTVEEGTFRIGGYNITYEDGIAYVLDKSNVTTAYADGTAVYFNPETGEKCTQAEYTSNDGSATNKKSGCMRWYTFGDAKGNRTIKMILDHNTSQGTEWVSIEDYLEAGGDSNDYADKGDTSKGPLTVIKNLKEDTKNWKQEITPRIITADEVAIIVGDTDFLEWPWPYTFKGSNGNMPVGTGAYAWLYSYLANCENYGCNKQDSNASWAYATSTARGKDTAWSVSANGSLSSNAVRYLYSNAVRPVITVSKGELVE